MNDVEPIPPPAVVYDERFVPALFGQWSDIVADDAGISEGHHVLDVACGTGVLACAAARRVGPEGRVVGLDPNDEMLQVARGKPAQVRWHAGCAEELPFEDGSFDRVVSQFGLMFFDDKVRALREAMRVLRPGGRMVIAVCDGLDHSPGYAVFAELLHRLFGHEVAEAFRAPFALGDRERLLTIGQQAGLEAVMVRRHDGAVRFDDIPAMVSTERACAWTLGGLLDETQFDRLLEDSEESMRPFLTADGRLEFVMPSLLLSADKDKPLTSR